MLTVHYPMKLIAIVLLAATTWLSGCATPPPPQPVALRQAAPGASILYVFRPSYDAVDTRDAPTLSIDGRAVAAMRIGSYASVDLAPGKHRIALTANARESKDWSAEADFETAPGGTYYVAIWHQRQPKPVRGDAATYGVVGPLVFQLLNPPSGERAVQLEPVARDIAEYAMTGLRAAPPVP